MEDALTALPGVSSLETHLKTDTFVIEYAPDRVSPEQMLKAIEAAGFKGRAVDIPTEEASTNARTIPLDRLPDEIAQGFKRAGAAGKLVIIDIHGPG